MPDILHRFEFLSTRLSFQESIFQNFIFQHIFRFSVIFQQQIFVFRFQECPIRKVIFLPGRNSASQNVFSGKLVCVRSTAPVIDSSIWPSLSFVSDAKAVVLRAATPLHFTRTHVKCRRPLPSCKIATKRTKYVLIWWHNGFILHSRWSGTTIYVEFGELAAKWELRLEINKTT